MIQRIARACKGYLANPVNVVTVDVSQEIDDELAFHLAERVVEGMAEGLPEEEARRRAIERFGDPADVQQQCLEINRGDLRILHGLHLAVTAGLLIGLVTLLWTTRHRTSTSPTIDTIKVQQLKGDLVVAVADGPPMLTGDVEGTVVDVLGKPIANADVLVVVKSWPEGRYRQEPYIASTDEAGTFLIEDVYDSGRRYAVQAAVVADQHVLASDYHSLRTGKLDRLRFELPAAQELALRFETEQGDAVSGIEVLLHRRRDAAGEEHLVYFCSAYPLSRASDEDGLVTLPYFLPGETAELYVNTPDGEWELREILVPEPGEVCSLAVELLPDEQS